jgi:phosphatidylserine synthase
MSSSPLGKVLLFAAAAGFVMALVHYGLRQPMSMGHGLLLGWFALITAALHLWQEPAMQRDPKGFGRRFMAGLALKMALSLLVALLLLLRQPKEERLALGIAFAGLYLAFLAFSTVRLSGLARQLPRK